MQLNFFYQKTPLIDNYLLRIEVSKKLIDILPQLPNIEENLRRKSLLKSSLFSAKIEGNKLNLQDLNFSNNQQTVKDIEKLEIFNILKALNWIYTSTESKLTTDTIKQLHILTMKSLTPNAGKFRTEPSAIFNIAGIAIYMTPPPSEILSLLEKLLIYINSQNDHCLITAALAHFNFEKIHPFLDGNGRVGRLLSTLILKNNNFSFREIVSLEEYLENQRETYYYLLQSGDKDLTKFVEFFLEGIALQAEKAIEQIKNIDNEKPEDSLLPRRREILEIIKDHKMVTFDFIRRRFAKIPKDTLHYDLSQLLKKNFIRKLGATRGVCYTIKE